MAQIRFNKLVIGVLTFFVILTYLIFIRDHGEEELLKELHQKIAEENKQLNKKPPNEHAVESPAIIPIALDETPVKQNPPPIKVHEIEQKSQFKVNETFIQKLDFNKGTLLRIFGEHYAKVVEDLNSLNPAQSSYVGTENTFCECGRVSEPCQCCAYMTFNRISNSKINKSIYGTVLLSSAKKPMLFCFSLQFVLKNDHALLSSFLLSPPENDSLTLDSKLLAWSFNSSNEASKVPLFTGQVLKNIHDTYELSSRSDIVSITLNLHSMDYKVKSLDDSIETSFDACSYLMLKHAQGQTIALYNFGCFRGHKGAAADQDIKEKETKVVSSLNNRTGTAPNSSHNHLP